MKLTHAAFLTLSLASPLADARTASGSLRAETVAAVVRPFSIKAQDGWVFKGELTLPGGARAGQTFPTVLLLHGSGPNDMNETVSQEYARVPGGSSNFLTISKRLNAAGFAVARFNKRGVINVGPKTISADKMVGVGYTPSGIARDALAVFQYVRQQPNVDASHFFLLGHSEGTDIASKLAAEHPDLVHGVITMGVAGDSTKDSLRLQIVDNQVKHARIYDRNEDGFLTAQEINAVPEGANAWMGLWKAMGVLSGEKGRYRLSSALDAQGTQKVSISKVFAPFLENFFKEAYPDMRFMGPGWGAYMRDAERFGYTTTLLPRYTGPVLMLNGDKDDQTPLSGAVRAYKAVKRSGNTDVTLKVYSGTGHTLSPSHNGVTTLGPMNERALADLTGWLKAHTR